MGILKFTTSLYLGLYLVVVLKWIKILSPYILITFLVIAVFGKTLSFGYTYMDDRQILIKKSSFFKNIGNITKAFEQDFFVTSGHDSYYYRPLALVSYIFDAQACGVRPACYHVTSLLFHLIFSLTLYYFFVKQKLSKLTSFLLAALFSVHPTLVLLPAWVTTRVDMMAALFFIWAFIFYDKWLKEEKKKFLVIHIFFINLAIYSKEISLLFFPLVILYYFLIEKKVIRKKLDILVWAITVAIFFWLRQNVIKNNPGAPFTTTIRDVVYGFVISLGKVIPIDLHIRPTIRNSSLLPGFLAGLILIFITFFNKRKLRKNIFWTLWFFVLIAPTFVNWSRSEVIYYESRLYLPFAGLLMIVGKNIPKFVENNRIYVIVGTVLIAIFSLISFNKLEYFRDDYSFWNELIRESPYSGEVLDAYAGITKIVHADDAKAIELYKKAIELEPNIKQSRLLLGVIYIEERKYDEAIKILEEDVKRKENYTKLFHLGRAYYGKGSDKEALETWLRAYKLAPDYLPLNVDLALLYSDHKNYTEAKKYYLNAIKLGGLDSVDAKLIQNMGFLEKY